jgi:hypothetical protein
MVVASRGVGFGRPAMSIGPAPQIMSAPPPRGKRLPGRHRPSRKVGSALLIHTVLVIAPLPVYKRAHKVGAIEMTSVIARRMAPGIQ